MLGKLRALAFYGRLSLLLWTIGFLFTGQAWAQSLAIGDFYAEPQVIIAADSPNYPGLLNQSEAIDLNGDGRDDAVYSGYNPGDPEGDVRMDILVADGSGSMALRTSDLILGDIPVTERGFRQIIPGDFNGDGITDLFLESHGGEPDCGDGSVNCWTGGVNSLLLSNSEGQWLNVTLTNLPAHSDFSHGSSVADFDKDGDIDIWVNNLGGSPLYNPGFSYLLHNDGGAVFTVAADASDQWQTPITGRNGILPEGEDLGAFWSFPVDAEGDGDMDLGLGWLNQRGQNVVLLNDGAGNFSWPVGSSFPSPLDYVGDRIQHVLVHDINNDGLDDVLLHQSRSDFRQTVLQVLISNGDGTFRDETSSRYPGDPVSDLRDFQLHDLDRDGHLDLFSHVNFAYADIRINDGAGNFRPLANDWLPSLGWNWIVLDVDGDGGTDFLSHEGYGVALHKMAQPYGPELDGTEQGDRLIGGAHDNLFRGFGGNDVLDGGLGNDTLLGGPGDDRIDSGPGNDLLDGGPGNDELNDIGGDDTFVLNAVDLTGNDILWDYGGNDTLVFADFGLERVASVSQIEGSHLQISFTDGGNIVIIGHFAGTGQAIERLRAGDCRYDISRENTFTSGAIETALGDCLLPISLSGTVVDKANGLEPVHPVRIWLWDNTAKEPLEGFSIENNADGSYLIENIPEGSYKVFYDAFGAANGYTDMLYDNVNCELGCDFNIDGDILELLSGPYEANVQMERRPLLSGRVTNDSGLPLAGVEVELINADGVLIATADATNAEGDWYRTVPEPGIYYVRTVGESISGYRPEVWQNKPCDDCDVTVVGTPIEVSGADVPGIDFRLSLPGAEKIFANGFDFAVEVPSLEVQQSLFNYAPDSPLVMSALMSDGGTLSVLGEKTPDGLLESVTSLRLAPADNPLAVFEVEFDELGRLVKIAAIFGTTTFSYDSGNVTVTSINVDGETESFVVQEPPQPASIFSQPQAEACDVSALFTQIVARGEVVFACDNAYYEDRKPGTNVPESLKMTVNEADLGQMWTVAVPQLRLMTSLGIDQPEISQHGYDYTLSTPYHKEPSYSQWKPCCELNAEAAANDLSEPDNLIREIYAVKGTIEKISNFTSCGLELVGTGGTVAPTCVLLVQSFFYEILKDAAVDSLKSELGIPPACSESNYRTMLERYSPARPNYGELEVVFEKTGVRGGKAVYRSFPQDLSATVNGKLPTLKIGPVPADFEPRTGIERIRAYRSDGSVVAQSGGQIEESAVIAVGEALEFRAFDQFFNRSVSGPFSNASHEANQYYGCADYSWTLRRNGNVVQTYTHGANDDRFRTQPLAEGDYQLSLSIDSTNKPYGDDYFGRQYMEGDAPSGSTISPAQATLNFTVKPTYTVSVEKVSINTGLAAPGGLVTSTPAGINCGGTCSKTFTDLESLQLTASNAEGWSFRYWTAPAECATEEVRELSTCDVNLAETVSATAVFEPDPVTTTDVLLGEYTKIGDNVQGCGNDGFTTAVVYHTGTFTGTMEDGGSIESTGYYGTDGVIEGIGYTRLLGIPGAVSPADGSVSWTGAYCWGDAETMLWQGFRYVNPLGVKSNEVRVFVPQP